MSLKGSLSTIVADNLDALCYMCDIETYDLLYLNKLCRDVFGLPNESDYLGKKCYKLLQGKDSPCEFCTNHLLTHEKPYTWEHHNKAINRVYSLVDCLVDVAGRKTRLEFAMDITSHHNTVNNLETNLETEKAINNCVQTLSENINIDEAIKSLLANVGNYYSAERAYIFEFDYKNNLTHNTYEWCKNPENGEIDNLQDVPLEHLSRWIDIFNNSGDFYISKLGEEVDKDSYEYKALEAQSINSLMAAPFKRKDGKVIGFIGVDNPENNLNNITLLHSVSLIVYNDLTKRRLHERLEQMNFTDTLTGCYNRAKYMQQVRDYEQNPPKRLGIIFADINGLRPVNDMYGQLQGDHFILKNAMILTEIFGKNVYRLGGDEFVAFCEGISEFRFSKMVQKLELSMTGENSDYNMSFGSVYKNGQMDISREIAYADELMAVEKQRYYKAKFDDGVIYKVGVVETLLNELKNGMFMVYYQPKVELKTGKISGAEALIRKRDNDGNVVPPNMFVPIYESEKIVRHIDFFVLETVCQILRKWMDEGIETLISVNLSRITFMEKNLVADVIQVCEKYNVPMNLIDLEITETSDKIDNNNLTNKIIEAKNAGLSVSLDDFGADYSNLKMLTSVEFSQVKLDKSLVDDICFDKKTKTVVEYAIKMCENLNMANTLAEGVETKEQQDALAEMNCKYGQGYLFSRPVPVDEFYKMLKIGEL